MSTDDRRKRRTQRQLAEALFALIQEKDYADLTVQEIAERADVGRATFYMHYRDKDALLDDAVMAEYRQMADTLGMSRDDPTRPVPARLLFEHVGQRADIFRLLLGGLGQTRVYFRTREVLTQFVMIQLRFHRAETDDMPLEWVALHIAGSLLTLLHGWLEAGMPHPPEVMEHYYRRLVGDGVRAVLGIPDGERGIL